MLKAAELLQRSSAYESEELAHLKKSTLSSWVSIFERTFVFMLLSIAQDSVKNAKIIVTRDDMCGSVSRALVILCDI